MKCYPDEKDEEQMRRSLGRYGLTGKQQVRRLAAGTACMLWEGQQVRGLAAGTACMLE